MDARAAKGIAANVRIIAEATAVIALIDAGADNALDKWEARSRASSVATAADGLAVSVPVTPEHPREPVRERSNQCSNNQS
jgi:hypothetical protein